MVKRIISCFVLILLFLTNPIYAQDSADSWTNNYVFNRGIFGCVYKVVMIPLKVVEYIIFGRYGVTALDDYFRVDKVFLDKKPKY